MYDLPLVIHAEQGSQLDFDAWASIQDRACLEVDIVQEGHGSLQGRLDRKSCVTKSCSFSQRHERAISQESVHGHTGIWKQELQTHFFES